MNIVLGVTGSISAYKTYDLLREFIKEGHEVVVVLSKGALKFVLPQNYRFLGAKAVHLPDSDFSYPSSPLEKGVLHIEIAKWCDRFIVAPLSANSLAKMANGMCDDLLTSIFISLGPKVPKIFYPAMNTVMYYNQLTQKNLSILAFLENTFVHPPMSGSLACGDTGIGKLPEIEVIKDSALLFSDSKIGQKVLITAGATVAPLDPVRYVTNPSSGFTGYSLAKSFLAKGCEVIVVAGIYATDKLDNLKELPNYKLVRVRTTREMHHAVMKRFPLCDLYISSAAISDIEFDMSKTKLKKDELKTLSFNFSLAPDILSDVIRIKRDNQKIVGFAAETDLSKETLLKKINRKPVDLLVGTLVSNGHGEDATVNGFVNDSAYYSLVQNGVVGPNITMTKELLGQEIMNRVMQ